MNIIPKQTVRLFLVALCISLTITGCGDKQPAVEKKAEKITNVTTAKVVQKDLSVTESAVGAATGVGLSESYDPTHATSQIIYIRLPFPIHVARQLRIHQRITLNNFGEEISIIGTISEIRSALDTTTQSREVIVKVSKPGSWLPKGSVRGEAIIAVHKNAIIIPETALVLRPKGTVVYVVQGDTVKERIVKTGLERKGEVEILSGLQSDEVVVNDGAALLTDESKIKTQSGTSS